MTSRLFILLLVALCVATLVCFEPPLARAAWGIAGTSRCENAEEVSDTSVSCSVAIADYDTGNVIVVFAATDNVDTTDGQTTLHSSVTDTDGNAYTKACEFTNSEAAAAAGSTVSVWFTPNALTATLAVGDTITLTTASAVTDKVVTASELTIGASNVVTLEGTCQTLANDGADAGSQTISGLTSQEYLFVRGIATESNAATSMTATTSYTRTSPDGCTNTTGGGEASDMGACGEFRIFTGTGDTSDPTLVDTSNDSASVYVALKEAAPPAISGQIIIISKGKPRPGAVGVRE